MSYILDALRRADLQRERGAVPSIHTQPVMPTSVQTKARRSVKTWAIAALSLLLMGSLAWQLLGRSAPAEVVPEPAAVVAMPLPVTPAPAAPLAEKIPEPIAVAIPPPIATSAATAAPAAERVTEVRKAPSKPVASASRPATARAVSKAPAAASAANTGEARVYSKNELPDEVQRALPNLVIGGAMYSEDPANRMLIINGQLFHEGENPAPDVSLEQIRLKAAVLKFKGYRYGITY